MTRKAGDGVAKLSWSDIKNILLRYPGGAAIGDRWVHFLKRTPRRRGGEVLLFQGLSWAMCLKFNRRGVTMLTQL